MLEALVLKKIRWRIIPFLAFSYLVAIIDRGNLSFASVSMNVDLHFSQTVYGLGVAAFYAGYSLFEVPSNLLLDRFGARRWLARIMVTWGLVSMAMALVHSASQFYLLRFSLGVAEAGFFPGVAHYLADWMPMRRRGGAISLFYIASPLGAALTGSLAVPLLSLDGVAGLRGWQWLFLVEGLPALAMAVLLLLRLPDSPRTADWLGADEKAWLLGQLERDAAASGPERAGLWKALSDPIVLSLGFVCALDFGVSAALVFSGPKLVLAQMHGTMAGAASMAVAMGVLTVPAMLLAGHLADRMEQPFALKAGLLATAAVGLVALRFGGSSRVALYGGYLLFYVGGQTAGMLMSVLISRFVHPGSRAAGLAMGNSIAQVGAFGIPILWGVAADATGGFELGLAAAIPTMLVASAVTLAAASLHAPRAVPALEPSPAPS